MIANVGSTDRIIRIIAGVALIVAFFFLMSPWNYLALLAGIALGASGITGFCGLYKLLGINTCKARVA